MTEQNELETRIKELEDENRRLEFCLSHTVDERDFYKRIIKKMIED